MSETPKPDAETLKRRLNAVPVRGLTDKDLDELRKIAHDARPFVDLPVDSPTESPRGGEGLPRDALNNELLGPKTSLDRLKEINRLVQPPSENP